LLTSGGDDQAAEVVESHQRWLWGPSHRTGTWARSHLTNGVAKDPGVQADQQLYPILQLVDFRARCRRWPAAPDIDWREEVAAALATLPRHLGTGLLASQENAADDPAELPYPFSVQVLYAHVLERLGRWQDELALGGEDLRMRAETVRDAARTAFTVEGPHGPQFAYEVDLEGRHRLYADANDLPTALAPVWGFCPTTSTRWRNTMRFAFSSANPSWSAGGYAGLGSMHTPGSWPLGDVQAVAWHQQRGDHGRAHQALERLLRTTCHDGLLPEAYDSDTGEWTARHWFGWPSAALGCLLVAPTAQVPT
jgi:meiotically up-regulated gene 157 (Mug157) protein